MKLLAFVFALLIEEFSDRKSNLLSLSYERSSNIEFLGKDPLPSLNQVYFYIQSEESCIGIGEVCPCLDVSKRQSRGWQKERQRVVVNHQKIKKPLKCEHCGRSRNTKETCWEPFLPYRDLPSFRII